MAEVTEPGINIVLAVPQQGFEPCPRDHQPTALLLCP